MVAGSWRQGRTGVPNPPIEFGHAFDAFRAPCPSPNVFASPPARRPRRSQNCARRSCRFWPSGVRWRCRPPERLLISPQDIRTGDATHRGGYLRRLFHPGRKNRQCHGQSPFALPAALRRMGAHAVRLQLAAPPARGGHRRWRAPTPGRWSRNSSSLRGKPDAHPAWEPGCGRTPRAVLAEPVADAAGRMSTIDDYRRFLARSREASGCCGAESTAACPARRN